MLLFLCSKIKKNDVPIGTTWQINTFGITNLAVVLIQNRNAMNIDKMEFNAWMERVMQRFDLLAEKILQVEQRHNIDGEELLDNQDVLQMLKISGRSLQRYRSDGRLPYYTISGKLYYKLSDVHQFIRDSFHAPKSLCNARG